MSSEDQGFENIPEYDPSKDDELVFAQGGQSFEDHIEDLENRCSDGKPRSSTLSNREALKKSKGPMRQFYIDLFAIEDATLEHCTREQMQVSTLSDGGMGMIILQYPSELGLEVYESVKAAVSKSVFETISFKAS